MFDLRPRFLILHAIHQLEALEQIAAAKLLVRHVHRRMTVHARARLLHDLLALGERLIVEHVGMPALFAEVRRERVSRPHRLQPRIFLEPRLRHDTARIGLRRRPRHRFAAAVSRAHLIDRAPVAVVLQREVLAPHRRIDGLVVQLDDAVERIARFLLAREDVDEQGGHRDGRNGREERGDDRKWRIGASFDVSYVVMAGRAGQAACVRCSCVPDRSRR